MNQGSPAGMLRWTALGFAGAICALILAMWGVYGPAYLLDLIAAYCF